MGTRIPYCSHPYTSIIQPSSPEAPFGKIHHEHASEDAQRGAGRDLQRRVAQDLLQFAARGLGGRGQQVRGQDVDELGLQARVPAHAHRVVHDNEREARRDGKQGRLQALLQGHGRCHGLCVEEAGSENDYEARARAGSSENEQNANGQSFQRASLCALEKRRTMQRLECEDGMPPACRQAESMNSPVASHLVKICSMGSIVKMMSGWIASDGREPDLGIGGMQN